MRLIDLDAFWNYVRSHKINFGKYQHDLLNKQPTVQAVPIPENATNGDVIKAMFPNAEYKIIRKMSGMDYIEIHGMSTYGFSVTIDLEWWNAPYEGSDKE